MKTGTGIALAGAFISASIVYFKYGDSSDYFGTLLICGLMIFFTHIWDK